MHMRHDQQSAFWAMSLVWLITVANTWTWLQVNAQQLQLSLDQTCPCISFGILSSPRTMTRMHAITLVFTFCPLSSSPCWHSHTLSHSQLSHFGFISLLHVYSWIKSQFVYWDIRFEKSLFLIFLLHSKNVHCWSVQTFSETYLSKVSIFILQSILPPNLINLVVLSSLLRSLSVIGFPFPVYLSVVRCTLIIDSTYSILPIGNSPIVASGVVVYCFSYPYDNMCATRVKTRWVWLATQLSDLILLRHAGFVCLKLSS